MSQHWYNNEAQLVDCDLREARKQRYKPSVSTIIHELVHSTGLDIYKSRQMFMSALTYPRPEGITDEAFYDLVKADADEHAKKAADFGTLIHRIATDILKTGTSLALNIDKEATKRAEKIVAWTKTIDYPCIVDWKTTETKDGEFKQPYDTWLFQLCGYFKGIVVPVELDKTIIDYPFVNNYYGGTIDYANFNGAAYPKLINLRISSNEDIDVSPYEWKPDKVAWGVQVFNSLVDTFRTIKKLN